MDESNGAVGEMESAVMGAEKIRAATGRERFALIGPTPPVDASELTFLAVDTGAPYTR